MMPHTVIPALRRLRQDCPEFTVCLGYTVRLSHEEKKKDRAKTSLTLAVSVHNTNVRQYKNDKEINTWLLQILKYKLLYDTTVIYI